jgi:hypothetical protein
MRTAIWTLLTTDANFSALVDPDRLLQTNQGGLDEQLVLDPKTGSGPPT